MFPFAHTIIGIIRGVGVIVLWVALECWHIGSTGTLVLVILTGTTGMKLSNFDLNCSFLVAIIYPDCFNGRTSQPFIKSSDIAFVIRGTLNIGKGYVRLIFWECVYMRQEP